MPDTREKDRRKLIRAYEQAQKDLIAILAASGGRSAFFRTDRLKRLREIRRVLAELERQSSRWAKKGIAQSYRLGAKEVAEALYAFEEKGFKVLSFSGVPEAAVSSLIEASDTALKLSIAGVYREMTRTLGALEQAAIRDRLTSALIRGAALEETKNAIIKDMKASGVTALRAQGGLGRKFTLRDYADIVTRHQTIYAYNSAGMHRLLAAGRRFALFSKGSPPTCDDCKRMEGKLIDLTTNTIPTRESNGKNAKIPPLHPRCEHTLVPISFAELERRFPKQYRQAVEYHEQKAA